MVNKANELSLRIGVLQQTASEQEADLRRIMTPNTQDPGPFRLLSQTGQAVLSSPLLRAATFRYLAGWAATRITRQIITAAPGKKLRLLGGIAALTLVYYLARPKSSAGE